MHGRDIQNPNTTFKTIAHDILNREAEIKEVTGEMFKLLDEIIGEAKNKIAYNPSSKSERVSAEKILSTIDSILINKNFVFPAEGLVALLCDGLTPKKIDVDKIGGFFQKSSNRRRINHIKKNIKQITFLILWHVLMQKSVISNQQ